jgi:hypothetical protein
MRIGHLSLLIGLSVALLGQAGAAPAHADDGFRYFPETNRAITGIFYSYWQAHGGLAQQGLPLSDEFSERSPLTHQPMTVQYFERAVFEFHPEYQGTESAVLLSLLGVAEYQRRYGPAGAPGQHASTDNPRHFPETGQILGGLFRTYWETHGGLAQQGYPISNEFTEVSALDGQPHLVHYFQRAVFEWHPENVGTPAAVLLAQLGTTRYHDRYPRTTWVPPLPGHTQVNPVGSGQYLVWAERSGTGPVALRARNLATGPVQEVASHILDQAAVALDGARVVWVDDTDCPPGACRSTAILSKDLATGQTTTVAGGPGLRGPPAIAGTTVAWLETNPNVSNQLLTKDLVTGAVQPGPLIGPGIISNPLISAAYIVWTESQTNGQSLIRVYNRQTGQTQLVAQETMTPGYAPTFALSGHSVVWSAAHLMLANLQTGFSSVLALNPGLDPTIAGETVLWSDTGPGTASDIWGLTLTDARPRVLVQREGNQWHPTLAGNQLVWTNDRGPNDGLLSTVPLAAALAAP